MRLILASASPRRAELLTSAGFTFDVVPADVDERPHGGESPEAYVIRMAEDKAAAVSPRTPDSGRIVLAADTIVVAAGQILGKPADSNDARRMLRLLSGEAHDVHTAVVVQSPDRSRRELATTRVWFVPLDASEIDWYVESGEPQGKAGGYAIQGLAARFIERIDGSWSNVVGLPLATVARMLKQVTLGD
jgi:septum formation protein